MATIKQGILGAFSGKVGSVVGSSWKGIPVMKSLPPSVSNPKTAKQIAQRNNMSQLVSMAQPILADVLKPLLDRFQSKQSGYNAFIKENMSKVVNGVVTKPLELSIAPKGNKAQLIDAIAAETTIATKKTVVNFHTISIEGTGKALKSDLPYCVLFNLTKNIVLGRLISGGTRENIEGGYNEEFDTPNFEVGDVCYFYLAFLRADGTVAFENSANAVTTVAPA